MRGLAWIWHFNLPAVCWSQAELAAGTQLTARTGCFGSLWSAAGGCKGDAKGLQPRDNKDAY